LTISSTSAPEELSDMQRRFRYFQTR